MQGGNELGGNEGNGYTHIQLRKLDKSYSGSDIRLRYVASTVYELPFGKARRHWKIDNPFVNAVAGGWGVSVIVELRSGPPWGSIEQTNLSQRLPVVPASQPAARPDHPRRPLEFPARKVTVNLAPADLPKESGRCDLPIALGILAATGQIPSVDLPRYEFAGELALTGELRAVRGALAMALSARRDGRAFVLPEASASEAAMVQGATVFGARSLLAVCAHLTARTPLVAVVAIASRAQREGLDLIDVRGQTHAKRALEIAAAGGHSLLFMGPPGTGKSMLAHRLPALLPPLAEDEALEVAAVASIAGRFVPGGWGERPFRAPHHTASAVALVGGGSDPRPGEISLAHHGVLFLDELPEWDRRVLEVLREPLETGVIHISRAARQSSFPAQFQLIAAMNPCPCGWLGDPRGRCHCTPDRIARYRSRVSGPLLDRIDLTLEVPSLGAEALAMRNARAATGWVHHGRGGRRNRARPGGRRTIGDRARARHQRPRPAA